MKKTLKTITLLKRKRRHGFRRRISSRGGRATLRRRRQKGRHRLIP
ncbi:MAG: 50S ribosomal protein L34 [Candidatus Omnitrophica bacterium]|nr:50S ribosomal protein L34 [Candidatus Omnitrophota bacterium]